MSPHYLIDSSIYVFRAWHVLPDTLTDIHQRPVNALLGFSDFLYEFLHHVAPTHMVLAFDESLGHCVRRDIDPKYKANRRPAPDELRRQFQECRHLARLLGITEAASGAYEADDIIGTLGQRAQAAGHPVHIVTGDKDLTQLIKEGDSWWDYYRNRRWYSRDIKKQWGVRPDQIADLLAIAGDKVDNIAGIPGVGPATAARLLNKFDTLDALLENRHNIHTMKTRGASRLQAMVIEHEETIRLARRLTGIFTDMPLDPSLSAQRQPPDIENLMLFLDQINVGAQRKARWLTLLRDN